MGDGSTRKVLTHWWRTHPSILYYGRKGHGDQQTTAGESPDCRISYSLIKERAATWMAARSFFCWLMSQQRFLGPGPHLAARRVAIESPRGAKREPTGRQMPPRIHSPSFKDKFIWMSRRMVKKIGVCDTLFEYKRDSSGWSLRKRKTLTALVRRYWEKHLPTRVDR